VSRPRASSRRRAWPTSRARLPADAGIVVSASHNPYRDNGIKIFAPDGRKLDDATERLIESDIYAEFQTDAPLTSEAHEGAGAKADEGVAEEDGRSADALRSLYLEYLCVEVGAGLSLEGLTVVVDCANGAASEFAPALLSRLGAHVVAINDSPDGRNINLDCGSLHTEHLRRRVVEEGAHLGVAFDGDADRSLFADARGVWWTATRRSGCSRS
jgi:phosphoglucosamine mutase